MHYPHRFLRSICAAAVLSSGGFALSACATHDDVAMAVGAETQRAQSAEAQLGAQVNSADATAKDAVARADAAQASAKHPFAYAVLLQDDSVVFKTNSATLSDEAQKRLIEISDKLKSENQNVYIEIQGHGDTRGSKAHNRALGERRAAAVREFLASQGVPLPRMTTISYGETQPKTAETDAAAHAQNRRVVLVVMG
jgi:outer membrane protein OmpA-like peptidoglycan-associated protein